MPTFATEAEIPEAFRAEYVQQGDVWRAQADIDLELEKAKKQTLLDEKKAEQRRREEAEQRAADLAREKEAKAKGVTDEELQKIREAEALARKPLEEKAQQLEAEVRQLKLTDRVRALAIKSGIMADRIDDAMLILEKRTELGDEGGIRVLDAGGKLTAEAIETFLTVTLRQQKPWLYEFDGGSGSGSGRSSNVPKPADVAPDTKQRLRQLAAGAL
jgi:hypothetical protein